MFKEKEVTLFPTYGYRTGGSWTVPVRVWVHKRRRIDHLSDAHIRALLSDDDGGPAPTEDEVIRCRQCVADFIADSDSGERVVLLDDAGRELYRFPSETNANGLAEGELTLPGDLSGRLTITARVEQTLGRDFEGRGRVMLLEPEGRSVVSDIDDTIKVSEIPAGGRVILRNTFLREYVAAEGMRERYLALGGEVSFHYVSGSPWQLFRLLHKFLVEDGGFPEGTFHMKSLRTSPLDLPNFIGDLKKFVGGKEYTKEQKVGQITELMSNLPGRKFTLVGDSGELDPEVFTQVRRERPEQVEKIIIRDVVNARERAPERLAAVDEVIEAPLVERGRSQFA